MSEHILTPKTFIYVTGKEDKWHWVIKHKVRYGEDWNSYSERVIIGQSSSPCVSKASALYEADSFYRNLDPDLDIPPDQP